MTTKTLRAFPHICCNPCYLPALARVIGYTPDALNVTQGPEVIATGTGSATVVDTLYRDSDTSWSSIEFLTPCDQFTIIYDGDGTISGADINGDAPGTVVGSINGSVNVHVEGSFTSPGNGTVDVTITGVVEATGTATIIGGVISPASLTVTLPTDVTITDQNPIFSQTSGTTFDFSGNYVGSLNALVYFAAEYTDLNYYGLSLELRLASNDAVIARWVNSIEGWRPFCPIKLYLDFLSPTYCPDAIECDICIEPFVPSGGCPFCQEEALMTSSSSPNVFGYSGIRTVLDSRQNSCVWSSAIPYLHASQISPNLPSSPPVNYTGSITQIYAQNNILPIVFYSVSVTTYLFVDGVSTGVSSGGGKQDNGRWCDHDCFDLTEGITPTGTVCVIWLPGT